jgi:hypothetical protein
VAGIFESEEMVARGNRGERGLHLAGGAKWIASPMQKKRRRPQLNKVLRAELLGFARRMKRVGKQQQHFGEAGMFRGQHGRLTAAVGMASQDERARDDFAHGLDGALQTFAIALGRTKRRSGGALLAKGQVATESVKAGAGKGFGDGDQ